MRKSLLMTVLSASLLAAGGAFADQLKIVVDSIDAANGTISGASPEMKSDVRTFHYRDQTAGLKISELKPGDVVAVDFDGSSGTNWLTSVSK